MKNLSLKIEWNKSYDSDDDVHSHHHFHHHSHYDDDDSDDEKKDNGIEYEACEDQIHFPFEFQLSMNPISAMHSNIAM